MNYKEALRRLDELKVLIEAFRPRMYESGKDAVQLSQKICEKYGEVEDIVEQIVGRKEVSISVDGDASPSTYANFIEAGYLSGKTTYAYEGYTQLLKVIGRVRRLAESPGASLDQPSVTGLIRVLGRFRECCQFTEEAPRSERDVQDIVWIMLRSHFDRIDREETLPRLGIKNYRPDFGVPELNTLVEVKFIGESTNLSAIQEELLADIPGYLQDKTRYAGIVILVYDAAQKLRDARRFVEDLRKVEGILDVVVVPGIG